MKNDELATFFRGLQNKLNAPDVSIESIKIPTSSIITLDNIKRIRQVQGFGVYTDGKNGIIVYIHDQFSFGRNGTMVSPDGESNYRFHMCECSTIRDYIAKQQYETKYVSHVVKWGSKTTALVDGKNCIVKMKPCKNCLRELNWSGYNHVDTAEKERIWNSFNIEKDYRDFFDNLPGTKYASICVPKNDYPTNWDAISYNFKKRVSFKCEFCGNENKLETHHINGDRSFCADTNLIVLCKECHEKIHQRPTTLTRYEINQLENRRNKKNIPHIL